jgi:hypothetical protein
MKTFFPGTVQFLMDIRDNFINDLEKYCVESTPHYKRILFMLIFAYLKPEWCPMYIIVLLCCSSANLLLVVGYKIFGVTVVCWFVSLLESIVSSYLIISKHIHDFGQKLKQY